MRRIIVFIFAMILFTPISPSFSADTGTVVGEGARRCKAFLKASGRKKNRYMIWIQGYFTSYNAIAPDITNVVGDHSYLWIFKRLEKICSENQEQYFNDALVQLIKELHPKGIRTGNPFSIQISED